MCPTGSKHERGILAWNKAHEDDSSNTLESGEVYNLPFGISSYLSSSSWLRFIPFCPPGEPSSPDGRRADTDALEPKQPLGHPEPSQIIIGVALWAACSAHHFGESYQRQLSSDLLYFVKDCTVTTLCKLFLHDLLEWHLQTASCIRLVNLWTSFMEVFRYMKSCFCKLLMIKSWHLYIYNLEDIFAVQQFDSQTTWG